MQLNGIERTLRALNFQPTDRMPAIGLYPDKVSQLFAYEAEKVRLENQALAAATLGENLVPFMWGGEDICGNQGPVVSPRTLKSLLSACGSCNPTTTRGRNPNSLAFGWKYHAYYGTTDQLLGVDGFQGLQQETGVDLPKLASMTTLRGEKTQFATGVNVPTVCFGTPEDVGIEVEGCARLAEQHKGGFLLCPASSFGPDVKKENIYAIFEYARTRQLDLNESNKENKE